LNDIIVSEGAESVFMIEVESYPAATVEWYDFMSFKLK
jgi:hypothetical protein